MPSHLQSLCCCKRACSEVPGIGTQMALGAHRSICHPRPRAPVPPQVSMAPPPGEFRHRPRCAPFCARQVTSRTAPCTLVPSLKAPGRSEGVLQPFHSLTWTFSTRPLGTGVRVVSALLQLQRRSDCHLAWGWGHTLEARLPSRGGRPLSR